MLAQERKLIHIPIIHNEIDMGELAEPIRRTLLQKAGRTALEQKTKMVDAMWSKIELFLGGLEIPGEKIRLYQDGLPVCGIEIVIVKELAATGSRNHRLLLSLINRGATLMGTESAPLLIEEYELAKKALSAAGDTQAPSDSDRQVSSAALLRKRDGFIAERINGTLRPGETGILFLGMLHSLGSLLDKDIQIIPFAPAILSERGTTRDEQDPQSNFNRGR